MPRKRKRKLAIRVKQSARITEKRDSITVARPDTASISRPDTLRKAPTEVPSNGIVFKVKVKKK
jgi:hypothetical protein